MSFVMPAARRSAAEDVRVQWQKRWKKAEDEMRGRWTRTAPDPRGGGRGGDRPPRLGPKRNFIAQPKTHTFANPILLARMC